MAGAGNALADKNKTASTAHHPQDKDSKVPKSRREKKKKGKDTSTFYLTEVPCQWMDSRGTLVSTAPARQAGRQGDGACLPCLSPGGFLPWPYRLVCLGKSQKDHHHHQQASTHVPESLLLIPKWSPSRRLHGLSFPSTNTGPSGRCEPSSYAPQ